MALITRISRLFHADMNAVLDQIEEPEMLLKQAIREMEETLAHDERQIKLQEYEHKQLSGREEEVKQSLTEIEDQLALCFKSKKDDLARILIKRKLEGQQTLKSLSRKASSLEESFEHLKTQLKEHQSQLGSMKQKAEIFTQDNTDKSMASWSDSSFTVQDEDIEVAFLHEKQKWSQS